LKIQWTGISLLLLLLILTTGCASTSVAVYKVIDGDTIEVDIYGSRYTIRYIGIDTPELNDSRPEFRKLAQQAADYNKKLLHGADLILEKDVSETDRYNRLLRYVYADHVFVNAELVRQGLAWAKAYPPDTRHQEYLEEMEKEARQAGMGIWAISGVSNP
jgi:micrococcal nuclease